MRVLQGAVGCLTRGEVGCYEVWPGVTMYYRTLQHVATGYFKVRLGVLTRRTAGCYEERPGVLQRTLGNYNTRPR